VTQHNRLSSNPSGFRLCLYNIKGGFAISYIIIDGYNLIGIYHKDLKKQRDMLIDSLIEYRKKKGHDITVVFDGWKTGEAQEKQSVTGGIRIIYSRIGEKADSVIKRIISYARRGWIVVTSDRDIANHAWASGSIPVSAKGFQKVLERGNLSYFDEEENDEEYIEPQRKGNPRKLSKKEKAISRALSKL
jgi:predicted RNA-binding protein with PIN domain